jgi:hypothetical protein
MFNFVFQGTDYNVKFRHSNKEEVAKMDADKALKHNHITTCTLSRLEKLPANVVPSEPRTVDLEVVGEAYCSKTQKNNITTGDRGYNKEDGRYISLDRALVQMAVELDMDEKTFEHFVSAGQAAAEFHRVMDREQTWFLANTATK